MKAEPADDDGDSTVSTAAPTTTGGSSDGKSGVKAVISSDKQRYNQFNYRIRTAHEDVKAYYKELVAAKDSEGLEQFMNDVIGMAGNIPGDFISRKRKTVDEDESEERAGWMSWAKAAEIEGADVLLEMVQAGTVQSRRHPHLPASSKVQYPNNLQVRLVQQEEIKGKRTSDEDTLAERDAVDSHSHENFVKTFMATKVKNKHIAASSCGASSVASDAEDARSDKGGREDARSKIAVQAIRKWHSAWDRAHREYGALVARSADHPNTTGCKFERDLKDLCTEGEQLDKCLVALEEKYLRGVQFSNQELATGAETTAAMQAKIKEGGKKAAALRPWFKL